MSIRPIEPLPPVKPLEIISPIAHIDKKVKQEAKKHLKHVILGLNRTLFWYFILSTLF